MKLNCDMGESYGPWQMGNDEKVMPFIDMANIACGFHASDPDIMAQTVEWAATYQVQIGAHPGYDDKLGFGRRSIPHALSSITHLIAYQVGALDAICRLHNNKVSYVKPHGALYNDMMVNRDIFESIVKAISGLNVERIKNAPSNALKLMILARTDNSAYQAIAKQYHVELLEEAFADRAYDSDGSLVSRSQIGAVYHTPERIKLQVIQLSQGYVVTLDGKRLALNADTVCVHGDNETSIVSIAELHKVLNP
ncbi:LamB/YcsF family protein [Photobacterium profundum]|uniref:5-oxoprolinase subunit PxpA n=1 Tax=Photobacterium profundum TaxID=74109 RepID=UPI003D1493CE